MHIADENRYETSSKGKDEGKGDREREREKDGVEKNGGRKKEEAREEKRTGEDLAAKRPLI